MQPGAISKFVLTSLVLTTIQAQEPATFTLSGDWEVQVAIPRQTKTKQTLQISPPVMITVTSEKYTSVPLFNPKSGGWAKGAQLNGVKAQETTSPNLLDAASFVLRAGPEPNTPIFTKGTDYEIDLIWGTFGRLPTSAIKPDQSVYATYSHAQMRLDAVVLTTKGQIILRQGDPRAAAPVAASIYPGERHLGNIFLSGVIPKLQLNHLFPITELSYPDPPKTKPSIAERLTPKAFQKLATGQPIRILAWGDSVTDGSYVPEKDKNRWQFQFVARLLERFPKANIELITEAWGGRNTSIYLAEPPGSSHNYREKVLVPNPDLIISEFVNDSAMKPDQVETRYAKLLADFTEIGAEWIILTPHYVRPDWMGLTRERDIDDDPRPYVAGLRQFATKHKVALADASLRYGRLWRQGIPYNTLMLNAINHPDARGMRLFADALMELFP